VHPQRIANVWAYLEQYSLTVRCIREKDQSEKS